MSSPYCQPEEITDGETEQGPKVVTEKYERCSFCNSRLLFSHELDLHSFEVIESSRCPGCGVSMTPKKFTLQ